MATLERIRNKAGLVIGVIGVGLVAFLLGDLMNSGGSLFRSEKMQVAEINGTSVSINDYQEYISELEDYYKLNSRSAGIDENTSIRLREQAWSQLVQDILMGEKFEEVGIQVTAEEIFDMTAGKNIHPQIRQIFTNPETGVYDKEQAVAFLQRKNNDPQSRFFWDYLEKQIKNERLLNKYRSLVQKGVFVTNAQAEAEAKANETTVNFEFINQRFTTIPDSTVNVSDSEISAYYSKNKEQYKQEETREVEYVTFAIEPSEEDNTLTQEWIVDAKAEFAAPATDPIQYVNMNSDNRHIDKNLSVSQLSTRLQDFVKDAKEGDVVGPYYENETYKLSRLVDIKQLPDSVKARHILINGGSPEQNTGIADSLLALAKGGADFAKLARENSKDNGSAVNGGDLNWFTEGRMVQPFNDACFSGKKGDIVKVESQFGIHIIHIQDKGAPVTKYNIATLERKVTYSSKTNQKVYGDAAKFAALSNSYDKFIENIETDNLAKRYGRNLKANDRNVGSLESPRELVRWAFNEDTSIGDMSPIFEFGDTYVIAYLTQSKEEGYTELAEVKDQIEREVRKGKKAEMITEQIKAKGASDLAALATELGTTVQTATDITFSSYQVPGAGVEPALVALATNSEEGAISAPIAGNNGVYVVKVTQKSAKGVDIANQKSQLQRSNSSSLGYKVVSVVKEGAEITDDRAKFY